MSIAKWTPQNARLGRDAVGPSFLRAQGRSVVVERIMDAVVADAGRQLQLINGPEVFIGVKAQTVQVVFGIFLEAIRHQISRINEGESVRVKDRRYVGAFACQHTPGFNISGLEAPAENQRV